MQGDDTGNRARGLGYALAGFALLSAGDGVVKSMSGAWPGPAVAALRYSLGVALLGTLVLARGRGFDPGPWRWQWARGACVAVATTAFFMALFTMPLASATAIEFISPMLTALLSALLLGERASRATLIASAVAFAGVLVILRPEVFRLGWAAGWPVLAAFGMAGLFITNRKVAGTAPALDLQLAVALCAAPIMIAFALVAAWSSPQFAFGWPPASVIGRTAIVACTASAAHWLIYLSTTKVSAAESAPMVYVQMLVAVAISWAFFATTPDAATLAGAALIIGAGLYMWRQAARG